MRSLPETRALLEGAISEIGAVARAHGVAMPESAVAASLAAVDAVPEQGTASMQRDIIAGRVSELESQVGVVVRMAHTAGVEAPIHTYLYASLLPQERRARGELAFSV
jgi:2-dehydropantoate 2-reductase